MRRLLGGRVVLREMPRLTGPAGAEAGRLLASADADLALDVPDTPLPFDAGCALAAAEQVGLACWFLLDRRPTADEVAALPPCRAVGEESQGPRLYEYAEVGLWSREGGLPGPRERLLARRSSGQEPELKYHRSNAPAEVPLEKSAAVRGTRRTTEEDIRCGRGECGLDEYETRGWVGWHHHTALALLALAFLALQKQRLGKKEARMTVPEVRALLAHLLGVRVWDVAEILAWSRWRRERNRRAAVSHRQRRLARAQRPPGRAKQPALEY